MANQPTTSAEIKSQQLTDEGNTVKQEQNNANREININLAEQIQLLKDRNKELSDLVSVEKDYKKQQRTLVGDIKGSISGLKEGLLSGTESFLSSFGTVGEVTKMFTTGFIRRKQENDKITKEALGEESKLNKKKLKALAEQIKNDEQLGKETVTYDGKEQRLRDLSIEQIQEVITERQKELESIKKNAELEKQREKTFEFLGITYQEQTEKIEEVITSQTNAIDTFRKNIASFYNVGTNQPSAVDSPTVPEEPPQEPPSIDLEPIVTGVAQLEYTLASYADKQLMELQSVLKSIDFTNEILAESGPKATENVQVPDNGRQSSDLQNILESIDFTNELLADGSFAIDHDPVVGAVGQLEYTLTSYADKQLMELRSVLKSIDFTNELLADGLFASPGLAHLTHDVIDEQKKTNATQKKLLANTETKEDRKEGEREQQRQQEELLGTLEGIKPPAGTDKKEGGLFGGLGRIFQDFMSGKGLKKSLASMMMSLIPSGVMSSAKGFIGQSLTKLGAAAGPLAIVAGVAMAIKDGITGWMSSEEWGVSKISGFLGGFLAGSGDGGIVNAFTNAGKWALVGAGIGAGIGGPPGAIAGGLVGAAIGGILGFIGAKEIAKGFDGIGSWFSEQFNTLILDPIRNVWDIIAPDWVKNINFEWSDIMPAGLTKLFNGDYFTVDVPEFNWYDLFPSFLVEWFNGTKEKVEKTFNWYDIFPQFLVDFFTGKMAQPDYTFSWESLVPKFIVDVLGAGKDTLSEMEFNWKSLLPNFIVETIDGVKVTGSFSWKDLVPEFIWKLVEAGKKEGTTDTGEFDWKRLLPDWMLPAIDSSKAIADRAELKLMDIFGDIDVGDKLLKMFSNMIDSVLSIVPGYETKSEKIQSITESLQTELAKPTEGGVFTDVRDANEIKSLQAELIKLGMSEEEVMKITGLARGGIVTKPAYLPSSGIVVGESATYSGRSAAKGAVTDGLTEAIIPLERPEAVTAISRPIAGAILNQMQMERATTQQSQSAPMPIVMDNSTQVVNNNTTVVPPMPQGPRLPGSGRDQAFSHFRHTA